MLSLVGNPRPARRDRTLIESELGSPRVPAIGEFVLNHCVGTGAGGVVWHGPYDKFIRCCLLPIDNKRVGRPGLADICFQLYLTVYSTAFACHLSRTLRRKEQQTITPHEVELASRWVGASCNRVIVLE